MRWNVVDSLYCPEQMFCSHLDSYSHYLEEAGEDVSAVEAKEVTSFGSRSCDVAFVLDDYQRQATLQKARVRIAQVAAICSPMPWEVRKPDGSPAYDLVISSLRWMVEEARKHGCRAEYMPLAFDTRARVCGMGVERDLDCIFIGTVGPNHVRRLKLLAELSDVVTLMPPVFGREYFRTLARAKVVLNVHAEWARGEANNMRMFEATGMGAALLTDGDEAQMLELFPLHADNGAWWLGSDASACAMRERLTSLLTSSWRHLDGRFCQSDTLLHHTYESRIPRLISLAKELLP